MIHRHDGKLQGIYNSESTGGEDGWVDPLAYDEAWLADDLPAPVLRPAIGALVKGGELRHAIQPKAAFGVNSFRFRGHVEGVGYSIVAFFL